MNESDYQMISSMHIDRLIVRACFQLRLIFSVSIYLSSSLSFFYSFIQSRIFVLFFRSSSLLLRVFLSISCAISEEPQHRYNPHKTLWPCKVSVNFSGLFVPSLSASHGRIDNRKCCRRASFQFIAEMSESFSMDKYRVQSINMIRIKALRVK